MQILLVTIRTFKSLVAFDPKWETIGSQGS
jgi:hypothetical protein